MIPLRLQSINEWSGVCAPSWAVHYRSPMMATPAINGSVINNIITVVVCIVALGVKSVSLSLAGGGGVASSAGNLACLLLFFPCSTPSLLFVPSSSEQFAPWWPIRKESYQTTKPQQHCPYLLWKEQQPISICQPLSYYLALWIKVYLRWNRYIWKGVGYGMETD